MARDKWSEDLRVAPDTYLHTHFASNDEMTLTSGFLVYRGRIDVFTWNAIFILAARYHWRAITGVDPLVSLQSLPSSLYRDRQFGGGWVGRLWGGRRHGGLGLVQRRTDISSTSRSAPSVRPVVRTIVHGSCRLRVGRLQS